MNERALIQNYSSLVSLLITIRTKSVPPSNPTEESLFPDLVGSNVPENVRNHESNVSDIDSNERDDIPLIHILKRGVFGKNT